VVATWVERDPECPLHGTNAFCTCPRDEEGDIDRGFILTRNPDGTTTRTWYLLTNPGCPLHGRDAKEAPY